MSAGEIEQRKCPPNKKARNGKIEIFRFLFSIAILLFHLGKYILGEAKCGEGVLLSLFVHGSIGVEFFFLVSGYLMAKSANKLQCNNNRPLDAQTIAGETWKFILSKYKGIWFYHVTAWVPTLILYCCIHAKSTIDCIRIFLESIPSLFLLQMSGIKCISPNHIEWYLSAMIIAMFLVYPILLRFNKSFSRIWAPFGALIIVGYLSHTTGRLTGVSVWLGITYKSVCRAVADLCLGVASYELSQYLSTKRFTRREKIYLSVLEYGCYGFVYIFMLLTLDYKYEVYALAALFLAVTISFSNASFGAKLFSNQIVFWLGEISLPIYVSQVFVITIITNYMAHFPNHFLVIFGLLSVILLAVTMYWIKRIYNLKNPDCT